MISRKCFKAAKIPRNEQVEMNQKIQGMVEMGMSEKKAALKVVADATKVARKEKKDIKALIKENVPKPTKKPYQLTLDEFGEQNFPGASEWAIKKYGKKTYGMGSEYHREMVKEALGRGENIPQKILKDYPDLKKPLKKEPEILMQEPAVKKDNELQEKRDRLRKEYKKKTESGEIQLPTRTERPTKTAQGHPDLEATQAARRLPKKKNTKRKPKVEPKEKKPEILKKLRPEEIKGVMITKGKRKVEASKELKKADDKVSSYKILKDCAL